MALGCNGSLALSCNGFGDFRDGLAFLEQWLGSNGLALLQWLAMRWLSSDAMALWFFFDLRAMVLGSRLLAAMVLFGLRWLFLACDGSFLACNGSFWLAMALFWLAMALSGLRWLFLALRWLFLAWERWLRWLVGLRGWLR